MFCKRFLQQFFIKTLAPLGNLKNVLLQDLGLLKRRMIGKQRSGWSAVTDDEQPDK